MISRQRFSGGALVLVYGVICYLIFLATFVYALGFVGNLGVPKALDSRSSDAVWGALAVDLGLLTVFAVQHSAMARPRFKRWLTRRIPAAAERSTYVVLSSLALALLFWQWRPIGGLIWNVEAPLGRGLLHVGFAFGWVLVLATTFLIDHFDLFGLRQAWAYFRRVPYVPPGFVTPGPYKLVRHPLYVGWLCAFWFTPTMTIAHLIFALATTAYILVAIRFEERDLVAQHGSDYVRYQARVPMLLPRARTDTTVVPEAAPRSGP